MRNKTGRELPRPFASDSNTMLLFEPPLDLRITTTSLSSMSLEAQYDAHHSCALN